MDLPAILVFSPPFLINGATGFIELALLGPLKLGSDQSGVETICTAILTTLSIPQVAFRTILDFIEGTTEKRFACVR